MHALVDHQAASTEAQRLAELTPEQRVEAFLLRCQQTDLNTQHFIVRSPLGVVLYGRQITIPADTVLTGAPHKTDHLVTVCGDIAVSTDRGVRRITGQDTFVSAAGCKRIGVAFADTTWTTFHVVTADSIDQIEEELTDEFDMLQTRRGLLPFDINRALEA